MRFPSAARNYPLHLYNEKFGQVYEVCSTCGTPLLAARLWLDHLPPLEVILLGTIAFFARYTAVYALNDVVDYRSQGRFRSCTAWITA